MSENMNMELWTGADTYRVNNAAEHFYKDAGQKVQHTPHGDIRTDENPIFGGALLLAMVAVLGFNLKGGYVGQESINSGAQMKLEIPLVRPADKPSINPVVKKFRTVTVNGVSVQQEYWEMENPNGMSDRQLREVQAYNDRK